MSTSTFLKKLYQAGIELQVSDNTLKCSAPHGVMNKELSKEIKLRKQEIIDFLLKPDPSRWSSLVVIKPSGQLTPFFCFHGVGGNVLNYAILIKYFDENRPLYGLQSMGLDGLSLPFSTIEKMAAHYLKEIETIQPHGPYLLGGGSMGGNIAFEVAQQLKAKDEKIDALILFDTFGSNFQGNLGKEHKKLDHFFDQFKGLTTRKQLSIITDKVSNKIEFHLKMKECEAYIQKHKPIPLDLRFWYIEQQNLKALKRYVCRPYDGEIFLIRSDMEHEGWYSDPQRGWAGIAKKLTIQPVPGKHETLVEQPELGNYIYNILQNLG